MYEAIAKLYDRATGGAGSAALPGEKIDDFFPTGPRPAGIDAAVEWFKKNQSDGHQTFLFLVGGPGGGKSHVSAQLVSGFTEIDPKPRTLAHRSYLYSAGLGEVVLVNDATIKIDEMAGGCLASELIEAQESKRSLIACVNRGILLEEFAFLANQDSFGKEVINWLHSGQNPIESSLIETTQSSYYIKSAQTTAKVENKIILAVVYLDSCSLLEVLPDTKVEKDGEQHTIIGSGYNLTAFSARKTLNIESVPALDLIRKVGKRLFESMQETLDNRNPICANIINLNDELFLHRLGNLLRAAEIASGQRFTYREIWGLISRLVIGSLPRTVLRDQLEAHMLPLLKKHSDPVKDFKSLQMLAQIRLWQSAFGVEGQNLVKGGNDAGNPVTSLMALVDPILDGLSGKFDTGDVNSGWTDPIMDAFSGAFGAQSPLEGVLGLVKGEGEDGFAASVQEFDRVLDKSFTSLMAFEDLRSEVRDEAIRWYSTYFSRMYATANGIPAFRAQTSAWIDLCRTSPSISNVVEKQLLTMLRPPRKPGDASSPSLIPIFQSRTLPIVGYAHEMSVAVELNDLKIRTRREGDELIMEVEEQSKVIAHILLDFPLMREALSCIEGFVGVTELSPSTAPRLERLRASRLVPRFLNDRARFSLVNGSDASTITVRTNP
jgi:hypothetical protein